MIKSTLCFLLKDNEILLAMKKRGFAAGKWNGMGGKEKPEDASIEATAKRETFEEAVVKPIKMKKVAVLSFHHSLAGDGWGQQVTVFLTHNWTGTPTETDEMAPKWFELNQIPYENMWEDDILWLPKVLSGKIIEGDFVFDENQKMIKHDITEVA